DDDADDAIKWKWGNGAATAAMDFGDPINSERYALCVYDESGTSTVLYEMKVEAGRGGKGLGNPPLSKGAKFHLVANPNNFTPDGRGVWSLRRGPEGRAKMGGRGRGGHLPFVPGPAVLPLPLRVQLQAENGHCWGAVYTTAKVNDGVKFKAKSQ